jgi:hypothetical protein
MKKLLSLSLCIGLVLAALPALAQSEWARPADVRALQDDLVNLEDALGAVPTSHARYAEFRDRADALREDVDRLGTDLRRQRRGDGTFAVTASDVSAVRNRIRTLQADVDVALDRRFTSGTAQIDSGATLQVRLDTPVSSATARPEDRVRATVARAVYAGGRGLLPAGTRVEGVVTSAQPANRPARGGQLSLNFDRAILPDGTRVDLRTHVAEVREDIGSSETGKRAGIGAALGGILGGVLGGKTGALVGVLVGGAGGAISSRGNDVELPEGTVITLEVDRPIVIRR